ncbi:MAG: LysM peptidoglycan-binding domain-containing M23 family metallopeptidase [Patescibacteria group bacterium]
MLIMRRLLSALGISISIVILAGCQSTDGKRVQKTSHAFEENDTDGLSPHRVHVVERKQTLDEIAALYGIHVEEIANSNVLEGEFIVAGQQLIIPQTQATEALEEVLPLTPDVENDGEESTSFDTTTVPKLRKPCSSACFVTQPYSAEHFGIDLQTRGGGPIFAVADGIVTRAEAGWNGGYGTMVEIDHGNGLSTLYGHNKDLYLQEGDSVTTGQVIGFMGNSGNVRGPTGIHLHFEVRMNGQTYDPLLSFSITP